MKGIDVSSHNGAIDWDKVRAAGTEFAILRAGYGKYASQQDSRFAANAEGALAAGVACGAYWFSYALTPDDAREEAQLCAQVLGPYRGRFSFPVWYDYEYDSERYSEEHGVTPNKELRTQLAVAFCAELERLGWRAGVYTNLDYIKNRLDLSRLTAWELWLADYTGGPDVKCGMQQTGSTGRIDGVDGNVDTDEAYLDYPALAREQGWNGYEREADPDSGEENEGAADGDAAASGGAGENTAAPGWVSDTTNGADNPVVIAPNAHYTVKITGQGIGLVCGESGGLPAAFRLVRCRREGNATLWHVIPVGEPGQEAGIYPAGGGDRIFVARIEEGEA